jgi:hypothetical protein
MLNQRKRSTSRACCECGIETRKIPPQVQGGDPLAAVDARRCAETQRIDVVVVTIAIDQLPHEQVGKARLGIDALGRVTAGGGEAQALLLCPVPRKQPQCQVGQDPGKTDAGEQRPPTQPCHGDAGQQGHGSAADR